MGGLPIYSQIFLAWHGKRKNQQSYNLDAEWHQTLITQCPQRRTDSDPHQVCAAIRDVYIFLKALRLSVGTHKSKYNSP